jgi:hypothetical protein
VDNAKDFPKTVMDSEFSRGPQELKLQAAIHSVSEDQKPLYCFICVGNPSLDFKRRTKTF